MASQTFGLLRQAIVNRKVVRARYKGHVRDMCPHYLGWNDGEEMCLLYQFAGGSSKGLKPDGHYENWRCLRVSEISQVQLLDGQWHSADNAAEANRCMDQVEVSAD